MLNNISTTIDSFQGIKTKFVETHVTNPDVKKQLTQFIASQSTFAKTVANAHIDFYTALGIPSYMIPSKGV